MNLLDNLLALRKQYWPNVWGYQWGVIIASLHHDAFTDPYIGRLNPEASDSFHGNSVQLLSSFFAAVDPSPLAASVDCRLPIISESSFTSISSATFVRLPIFKSDPHGSTACIELLQTGLQDMVSRPRQMSHWPATESCAIASPQLALGRCCLLLRPCAIKCWMIATFSN